MYEKILVPLDGSKRAEMIRPHVRELASRFQATVIPIMVIENTYIDGDGEPLSIYGAKGIDSKLKDSEDYLESFPTGRQK